MSGLFIVIEGPDGSGSTLHSALLAQKLTAEGYNCLQTAEPTEGAIGKQIRTLLHAGAREVPTATQLLFCADRAEHISKTIRPALAQGTHVVCDRYALSTIIYGQATGVDPNWLQQINDHFLQPDLCFVALPPFSVCQERLQKRQNQDEFEGRALQEKIYNAYTEKISNEIMAVDTSQSKEASAAVIWDKVKTRLELK